MMASLPKVISGIHPDFHLTNQSTDNVALDLHLVFLRREVDSAFLALQLRHKHTHSAIEVLKCKLWILFTKLGKIEVC
jgi:hypothetical protein